MIIGGAALVLFIGEDVPVAAVPVETYRIVVKPAIPAIPLFTLTGYLLAEGKAGERLVRLFRALQARTTDLTKSLERQTAASEIAMHSRAISTQVWTTLGWSLSNWRLSLSLNASLMSLSSCMHSSSSLICFTKAASAICGTA